MQHLQLDVAAEPSQLSLPRLLIGGVAALVELGVDLVEDLQLALDELCVSVMADDSSARQRLNIVVQWDASAIRVEVTSHGELAAPLTDGAQLTAYSQQILDALVDDHGTEERDGLRVRWMRLQKRTDPGAL